jgi:hypothetical protein
MPASVVKTPQDEKHWQEAKAIVEKQYGTTEGKWGVVMTIFKNKQNAHKKQALQQALQHQMALRLAHRMMTAEKWKFLPEGWSGEKKATADKQSAIQELKRHLQMWGFRDVFVGNSGGNWVDVTYAHDFPFPLRAQQFLSRKLRELGIKTRNSDFGPGDIVALDLTPLMGRGVLAKVDPERQCKLLMRNFRTMVNAAVRKGGDGGMDDLGAIGDALNWLKSIKSQDKVSEYTDRARESLKGIKSHGAFLKAFQELLTAAQKMPPKRYPSMGHTAIRNALYDLSDAVVSMVMTKNRAQRAISDPDHYDANLKRSFQRVQSRLDGFVARQLTSPVAAEKPKAKPKPKPKPKAKAKPKPAPEPDPGPEEEESTVDDFGLSGRYKNRAEQGNPKAKNPGSK